MIRYDLRCASGHDFEAWFASSAAYDDQAARGLVACALCGETKVEKALMAPRVPKKGNAKPVEGEAPQTPMTGGPDAAEIAKTLTELRKKVEANSDYVGDKFAAEARSMHLGDTEHRSIYGEATTDQAKSLIEDGVPVAPLPFMPRRND